MPIEIHQLDIVPDAGTAQSGAGSREATRAGTTPPPAAAAPSPVALRDRYRELTAQAARLMAD